VNLKVDLHSPVTPSQQLEDAILDAVVAGKLSPGDRLPSVRGVAETALVNPNTVSRAWRALELRGVVEGRAGSGVFVKAGAVRIARKLRGDATLQEFERAAREALRAGHDADDLRERLESLTTLSRSSVGRIA
jgi:GntR family transcriptional regulator